MTEDGEERVYLTRYASIESYFTDDGEGGVTLSIVPGVCAYPPEFERNREPMRQAVLSDVAQRLSIEPDAVLDQPFSRLKDNCAPPLPDYYRFARRPKSRTFVSRS